MTYLFLLPVIGLAYYVALRTCGSRKVNLKSVLLSPVVPWAVTSGYLYVRFVGDYSIDIMQMAGHVGLSVFLIGAIQGIVLKLENLAFWKTLLVWAVTAVISLALVALGGMMLFSLYYH